MSSETPALMLAIRKVGAREDLSAQEAEAAFTEIMRGRASETLKAALLMGLRAKGETPDEVAGGVRALRSAMVAVSASAPENLVDTCGTGGGSLTTFNISTAAGFVLAGGGVRVAKHGNRSYSSRCGSADVLEMLGVGIEVAPGRLGEILDRVGLSFLFAPALHPAMKHLVDVRRELAVPTIMNLLGPLTNPAGARRQVVGVADPNLLSLVGEALADLGHLRALVVHGEPGLDELSPLGVTRMVHVREGQVDWSGTFDPEAELGWSGLDPDELRGGEPAENARLIREVLSGGGPRGARAAVALNAGAGFYVAGVVESITDGVGRAESILDEGGGLEVLEALGEATKAADGSR